MSPRCWHELYLACGIQSICGFYCANARHVTKNPPIGFREFCSAEGGVACVEFLRRLEEADDYAVLGIRGHPVPSFWREERVLWIYFGIPKSVSGAKLG